jgi:C4-dicarboxylate transporter DctM subunit
MFLMQDINVNQVAAVNSLQKRRTRACRNPDAHGRNRVPLSRLQRLARSPPRRARAGDDRRLRRFCRDLRVEPGDRGNDAQIALPEMRRYGYDDRLATGSVAAGGTIGILIPPSIIMVIYGLLTETSISQLFLAGFLPGILTVVGFMLTIAVMTRIDPRLGPPGKRSALRDRIIALRSVWGAAALFLLVIGGLYIGVFSPTEAASIGAVGALALGILNRSLTYRLLGRSLLDTVKTTAMIFTILIGAILFNNFLILASMPTLVSGWITGLPLGKTAILLVILGMYFILGCLLDSLAMILLTIPIVFPIIQALGYDPVWFGIIIVMVVELGLITPPIGMNVFVIKGIAREVPLETIFRGAMPFVGAQIILIFILIAFPEIALWLPSTMAR